MPTGPWRSLIVPRLRRIDPPLARHVTIDSQHLGAVRRACTTQRHDRAEPRPACTRVGGRTTTPCMARPAPPSTLVSRSSRGTSATSPIRSSRSSSSPPSSRVASGCRPSRQPRASPVAVVPWQARTVHRRQFEERCRRTRPGGVLIRPAVRPGTRFRCPLKQPRGKGRQADCSGDHRVRSNEIAR